MTNWLTAWLVDWLTYWLTNFSTSDLQKVVRTCCALYIFTCKCASQHSGKIAPKLKCFVHFDLQMCFAPHRHAMFRDCNCKNRSRAAVFCTFWPKNVLRATAACHFSFLGWTATSAPAALGSLLFEHPEPGIIDKTQQFSTFRTFRACVSSF